MTARKLCVDAILRHEQPASQALLELARPLASAVCVVWM
jgi:hypothetical protein